MKSRVAAEPPSCTATTPVIRFPFAQAGISQAHRADSALNAFVRTRQAFAGDLRAAMDGAALERKARRHLDERDRGDQLSALAPPGQVHRHGSDPERGRRGGEPRPAGGLPASKGMPAEPCGAGTGAAGSGGAGDGGPAMSLPKL